LKVLLEKEKRPNVGRFSFSRSTFK